MTTKKQVKYLLDLIQEMSESAGSRGMLLYHALLYWKRTRYSEINS